MMSGSFPKCWNQNTGVCSESAGKRLLNFGLTKILIQTSDKSKVRAKTNNLSIGRRSVFVSPFWVRILQEPVMVFEHLTLRMGLVYV